MIINLKYRFSNIFKKLSYFEQFGLIWFQIEILMCIISVCLWLYRKNRIELVWSQIKLITHFSFGSTFDFCPVKNPQPFTAKQFCKFFLEQLAFLWKSHLYELSWALSLASEKWGIKYSKRLSPIITGLILKNHVAIPTFHSKHAWPAR